MKTIPIALQTSFENGTIATCIKLTRKDGTILGFTDHDIELLVDTITYKPTPGLTRVLMNLRSNAEVSNQEFVSAWTVDLDENDLRNGVYDEASLEVFRLDWTDVSAGTLNVFTGTLGLIQWTEDGFRADVQSLMKKLSQNVGVITTAKCRHQLFDQADDHRIGFCGINKASHTYSGSVASITTNKFKFDISVVQSDGWFANGYIKWTSGNNTNLESYVKIHASNAVELFLPTPFLIQVGDTFEIYTGCDKNKDTCKNKFNNLTNFGGFPHIRPEINFK